MSNHSSDTSTVRDNVFTKSGSKRLYQQGLKQRNLSEIYTATCFQVPNIISLQKTEIEMEYISSSEPIPSFLTHCSPDQVCILTKQIVTTLSTQLHLSQFVTLEKEVILEKCQNLKSKISDKFHVWIDFVQEKVSKINHCQIPIGPCHGNMILGNILYQKTSYKYFLINMLDTYLESVFQDIAALYQDIRYKWFLYTQHQQHQQENVRVKLYLQHLDEKLTYWVKTKFSSKQCELLQVFLIIKLLRILPYCSSKEKKSETEEWVENSLKEIIKTQSVVPTSPFCMEQKTTFQEDDPSITLIVPCIGRKTSYFPDTKQKYLLTQPSGHLMIEEAISCLPLYQFNRILIIVLRDHFNDNVMFTKFSDLLYKLNPRIEVLVLRRSTIDVVEAVQHVIRYHDISGLVFVKDCDTSFTLQEDSLKKQGLYVVDTTHIIDTQTNKCGIICLSSVKPNRIINIVEKDVFHSENPKCVNGYLLEASLFTKFPIIKQENQERVMTDVMLYALLQGVTLLAKTVNNYKDWGRIEIWQKYREDAQTYFIDLDGTLFKSTDQLQEPDWGDNEKLMSNIELVSSLASTSYIIFVTSRPESYRMKTMEQLEKAGLRFNQLLMGLPNTRRVLINNYEDGINPYPAAMAINLKKDVGSIQNQMISYQFSDI
jgi:hypothetical protein